MIIGLMGQAGVGKDTAGAIIAAELGGTVLAFADPIKRWCMLALKLREEQLWGSLKEKETPIKKSQLKALEHKGPLRMVVDFPTTWASYLADACCVPTQQSRQVESRLWTMREWWVNRDVELAMHQWWREIKAEPGLTPRRVMQHFGTEFVRRRLGPKFWIQQGMSIADQILEGGVSYSRTKGVIPMKGDLPCNAAVFTDVRFRNELIAIKRRGGEVYGVFRPKLQKMVTVTRKTKLDATFHRLSHASELEQLSVPQFWLNGRFMNRYDTAKEFEDTVRYVARKWAQRGPVVF
jgi:hypothetical protein